MIGVAVISPEEIIAKLREAEIVWMQDVQEAGIVKAPSIRPPTPLAEVTLEAEWGTGDGTVMPRSNASEQH